MDVKDIRKHALEALELPAQNHGFELVDIVLSGSTKNPTLTVFLDNNAGNKLEDLSAANEWVEEIIEAETIFSGSYTLEISSPGINRHLRKLTDFERFVGQKAEIKIRWMASDSLSSPLPAPRVGKRSHSTSSGVPSHRIRSHGSRFGPVRRM